MSNPRHQVAKRSRRHPVTSSRSRRQTTRKPAPQAKEPDIRNEQARKSRVLLTVIPIAVIIVFAVVGWSYWQYVWPFQRVIIKVEDDSVSTRYFLKRMLIATANTDAFGIMQSITEELIVKQEAPKMGIPIPTADEIDAALRSLAKGSNDSISDDEFNAWYRQQLNSTQLTDREFRDIISNGLLKASLNQILEAQVSSVGPQVHLYTMVLPTYEDAVKAKARVDEGESFTVLAKELSLDSYTKDSGGEIGWVPPGALDDRYSYAVELLDVDVCSEPVNNTDPNAQQSTDPTNPDRTPATFSIFWVSEKSVSMPIEDRYLSILKSKVLQNWLNEQMTDKKITFHGMRGGGFDSVTSAWLSYQAERLKKGMTGETATSTTGAQGQ